MTGPARDPHDLLGRNRAATLLVTLAIINLGYAAALIWLAYIARDARVLASTGLPIPDFTAFWAAGRMALDGAPALAYDWQAHRAVEVAGLGHEFSDWMPWHYPPPFHLLITPFAALPHWGAMALWCGLTLGLYLWTCWRILPDPLALVAALAVAPTAMILVNGQTGFLVGALLGLALLEIDRRPFRAGLLLGLLGFKPHLVAAIPLPLIATARWTTIAGGLAMLAALVAVSWAVLGGETWSAFLASTSETAKVFANTGAAEQRWEMGASLYGGLRHLGAGFEAAMVVHGVAALAVLVALVRAWRNPATTPDIKAALICYATLAATPRVLSYDLHIVVIGALFQCRHSLAHGFYRGEQALLAVAALGAFVALLFSPGLNPVLALALFAGCWLGHARRGEAGRR
ncbi:MAG: DUF2029 domain-containing protein [Proteobacteria bacterium]|nr:DUF2029 domain-containing protein [Pseudomonadota bacterium]